MESLRSSPAAAPRARRAPGLFRIICTRAAVVAALAAAFAGCSKKPEPPAATDSGEKPLSVLTVQDALSKLENNGLIQRGGVEWHGNPQKAFFFVRHLHWDGSNRTYMNVMSDYYTMHVVDALVKVGAGPACIEGASFDDVYQPSTIDIPGQAPRTMTADDFRAILALGPGGFENNAVSRQHLVHILPARIETRGAEDPALRAKTAAQDAELKASKEACKALTKPVDDAWTVASSEKKTIGMHPVWDEAKKNVIRVDFGVHKPGVNEPERIVHSLDAKHVREVLGTWKQITHNIDSENGGAWQVPRDDYLSRMKPRSIVIFGGAHKKALIDRVKKNPADTGICIITPADFDNHAQGFMREAEATNKQLTMLLNLATKGKND
jgi:hypothetical protein